MAKLIITLLLILYLFGLAASYDINSDIIVAQTNFFLGKKNIVFKYRFSNNTFKIMQDCSYKPNNSINYFNYCKSSINVKVFNPAIKIRIDNDILMKLFQSIYYIVPELREFVDNNESKWYFLYIEDLTYTFFPSDILGNLLDNNKILKGIIRIPIESDLIYAKMGFLFTLKETHFIFSYKTWKSMEQYLNSLEIDSKFKLNHYQVYMYQKVFQPARKITVGGNILNKLSENIYFIFSELKKFIDINTSNWYLLSIKDSKYTFLQIDNYGNPLDINIQLEGIINKEA